jgi:diguanylate cyclase (GGDEF)-like protein
MRTIMRADVSSPRASAQEVTPGAARAGPPAQVGPAAAEHSPMTSAKRLRLEMAAWIAGVASLLAAVWFGLDHSAERLLSRSAEQTALRYAEIIVGRVPELPRIFDRQRVSDEALAELKHLRRNGDVFRFKLFDREGHLLMTSDDLDRPDPLAALGQAQGAADAHLSGNALVRDVVLGGGNAIEIKSGAGKADRPSVYTEAYVPMLAAGAVIGVVEVYVDSTVLAARIQTAFVEVATVVGGALLLVGAAGTWLWWRRQSERLRADSLARYLAEHDVTSGALNRASFVGALHQAAERRGRSGAQPGLAVLLVDIDDFKDINDIVGNAGGDAALREATRRLQALVRQGDLVARLGSDVFAILQTNAGSSDDVQALAARVAQALAEPIAVGDQRLSCTCGIGAARLGVDAVEVDDLLQKADLALKRAKAAGRGRVSFYDAAIDKQLEEHRELVRDLRQALADGSLTMHYQALHAGDGRTLLGYEALMRWKHPTRGMVPPSVFIPLAESTGLIEPLGHFALHSACAEAAKWPAPLSVSVNLSAAQFAAGADLVGAVQSALDQAGLPAGRLVVEITESLLLWDVENVMHTLSRLSQMGVAIAMDDFGTGYSSLAYLWRFPFDKVKIDRAFTQGLGHDEKVMLIVRSIVSLAHSLGIRVNAEGVETESQMSALQNLGCDEVQGFLLSRPMPADTLTHAGAARAPAEQAPAKAPERLALSPA